MDSTLDNLFRDLSEIDFSDPDRRIKANAILRQFPYQEYRKEFDPSAMIVRIIRKGGNNVKNDVRKMIILFILRGDNLENMLSKATTEDQSVLRTLISRYGIRARGTDPQSVTLPRIAACFPRAYISALTSFAIKRPVSDSYLANANLSDFPKSLTTKFALSCINFDGTPITYRAGCAVVAYSICEHSIINPDDSINDATVKKVISDCATVKNYTHISLAKKQSFNDAYSQSWELQELTLCRAVTFVNSLAGSFIGALQQLFEFGNDFNPSCL